jgi:hypothetical protein
MPSIEEALFLAAHDGSGMRVSALRCPTTAKAATPRNSASVAA